MPVDADGRRGSCSRESTPLHADWPPASLSIPAQQFDQSQNGHLSREPLLPGADAFLAAEAGHFGVSGLSENDQFLRMKDSARTVEPQMLNAEQSFRAKKVEDQLVSDVVSSSLVGVDEQQEGGFHSQTFVSQETRTMTIERKSVPTLLDDISEASDGVQLTSRSEFSHVRQETMSQSRETAASSHQASGSQRPTDISAEVQSRCLDVADSPTLQHVGSHSLPQSDSTLPSIDTGLHRLITSGTAATAVLSICCFFDCVLRSQDTSRHIKTQFCFSHYRCIIDAFKFMFLI